MLDIGCGEGRLTATSLREGLRRLDLVEPSTELLARARRRLDDHGVEVVGHHIAAEELAATVPDRRWDLAQSTFALHAVAPGLRAAVLADLATRVGALLIVEFDCPAFTDRGEDHLRHLVDRYEVGLSEYAEDPIVGPGFLLPVLVAQIAPDADAPHVGAARRLVGRGPPAPPASPPSATARSATTGGPRPTSSRRLPSERRERPRPRAPDMPGLRGR